MTQILMDFLGLMAPAPNRIDDPPVKSLTPDVLAQARHRFETRLETLNRRVARLSHGGRLIGMPLCPSACTPGPLADFVLGLGTDPYRRWNVVLYADGAPTARALNTLPYRDEYEHDIDHTMVQYLTGLKKSRDHQLASWPTASDGAITNLNQTYRKRLYRDCARIEATLFGARMQQWQLRPNGYSDKATADASPPSAPIRPIISSGSGAENRRSSPVTG